MFYLRNPQVVWIELWRLGYIASIVTYFRMDDLEFEPQWGAGGGDMPHLSRPNSRPTQYHTTWVFGFVPGFKRPGSGVDHLQQSSAEIIRKDRAVLVFTP